MAPKDERPMRERMAEYVLDLQERIVTALEGVDPASPKFKRDKWSRAQGGYGVSCVFPPSPPSFEEGKEPKTVLEKGGVNVSVIHGRLPAAAVKQMRADHAAIKFDPDDPDAASKTYPFFAAGLSLVIHPRNPNAPTVHCNYRYFELGEPSPSSTASQTEGEGATGARGPLTGVPLAQRAMAWWFGGGADLTPSYLFPEDAVHFHRTLKTACAAHGSALFPAFKKWCDEYFFIAHRGEARGIGGIFFDDFSDAPHPRLSGGGDARPTTLEGVFAFAKACGDAFNPSYIPILSRRHALPFTPAMRRWQLVRRGRYVEFNLVYDRGTKFGLMTPGARIESILMSLPETARWEYMSELGTQADTEEAKLVSVLKTPKEWV
ncbi:HEM13 [Sanghuangporus weigelae]